MYTTLIHAKQLASCLERTDVRILDVRHSLMDAQYGLSAYHKGHIPNALHVDLSLDLSGKVADMTGRHPLPEPEQFRLLLGRLGITPQTQIVVYDDVAGLMAARLWWMCRWVGHQAVAVLDGGIAAWGERSLQSSAATVVATDYPPLSPSREAWVSIAELEQALLQTDTVLIDARGKARYRGDEEPLDSRAGHIPKAINYPHTLNLAADGTFLAPEQIRSHMQSILGEDTARSIHSCGSGVTACHTLLALAIANLPMGRLYVGSFSQWSSDPNQMVVTGDAP